MKIIRIAVMPLAWIPGASVIYAILWATYRDNFPDYSRWMDSLVLALTRLDPWDTGTPEDYVFTYTIFVSFLNVCLLTLAAWLIWRYRRTLFAMPRHYLNRLRR